mgnify:CR=1 FL=1
MDVHVFSEGRPSEFGPLQRAPRVHSHLNAPLPRTAPHAARADAALVLAHSTLSDVAAVLSDAPLYGVPGQAGQLRYAHEGREIAHC